ncbi:MAG: hypothetical protein NXI04_11895 [Planctomycetaceae bacterium]|nr:hypothetical protein [Planctomycetaceae bacterium]
MKTSQLLARALRPLKKHKRRRPVRAQVSALENLESRQLLTAAMMWDGDALKITGSDDADFIAVQQDELGLKVFTEDAVFTEYEGRALETADSVEVFGGGGSDVLFSYQTEIPVTLHGEQGHDVLFSNRIADVLDGGEGYDWIQRNDSLTNNTDSIDLGISGFRPDLSRLNTTPELDADGRLNLAVSMDGEFDVAGTTVEVTGTAAIDQHGAGLTATGFVASWEDAFGVEDVHLADTSLTIEATAEPASEAYSFDLTSTLDLDGTEVTVEGSATISEALRTVTLTGSVDEWDDAFGITGLDLSDVSLSGSAAWSPEQTHRFDVQVAGDLQLEDSRLAIDGEVAIRPDRIDAVMAGSVENWDDAFGIDGLDLQSSELQITAFTDRKDDYAVRVDVEGNLNVVDTAIAVTGGVELTPEDIDAVFSGSVTDLEDAFGIDGLDIERADLEISAYSDRDQIHQLQMDLAGELDIEGMAALVDGRLSLTPEGMAATLDGFVDAAWDDAFGLAGLDLDNTRLAVEAVNSTAGSFLNIGVQADLELAGTDVDVTGEVQLDETGVRGSLSGVVAGTWVGALGLSPLHLKDTTLAISGSKTKEGSEFSMELNAGMDLLGTDLDLHGQVDLTADGLTADLTATLSGEWINALGVPGLQLKDTSLNFTTTPGATSVQAGLDTDIQLFGRYIDVIGDLTFGDSGIDFRLSPPQSLDFDNLLGIPGFSLDDADLTVEMGSEGLTVAVDSTMNMAGVDVDYTGAFSVTADDVTASFTGRVDEWDNAFAVPGLNLNDVVLTLGAEYGTGGASMMIGLGAGIEMGSSEVSVAGMVGFGTTGWEVAFRGETESLASDDLIDFANTMNRAADPNARLIAAGTLGDLELRAAFINFAPHGGNAALGIEDGFGIGGAFYNDGKLLGSGVFVADLATGTFEAGLNVPELKLGPVTISDVIVDMRLSPQDAYFRAEGAAELMGADVRLKGEISKDAFSLEGSASLAVAGLDSSVTFFVNQTGVTFVATAGGAAINAIKDNATAGIRAAANVAQTAIDAAQSVVDAAEREVRKLESELDDARAEAQKEVDKVKANIAKAKSVVDSAARSKSYWLGQKNSRYRSWRSAVAATRRAKWWQKPSYKAKEVARYASYAYASGRYAAQVAVHKAASVAYTAVRDAAGWVLDTAGVEANPEVIRLRALLTVAHVGVGLADTALTGLEAANAGILHTLDVVDSLKVNRITISGSVSNYTSAGVGIAIDTEFQGRSKQLSLHASTDELFKQIGTEVLGSIL